MYRFGAYTLLVEQRLLVRGQRRVRIGARAMDILLALADERGEFLSVERLMSAVWPGRKVSGSTFRVTISALRESLQEAAFGQKLVVNVRGRGYRLVPPVEVGSEPRVLPAPHEDQWCVPRPQLRVIGRDRAIAAVQRAMLRHRLVTVVGPGGMGKTTVALAACVDASQCHQAEAYFVDLSATTQEHYVAATIARALGIVVLTHDVVSALIVSLRQRRLLLVLDSCEHVLGTCAELIDRLLGEASGLVVLATSREPLCIRGERVLRLAPLSSPPDADGMTLAAALQYTAVELFVSRAQAGDGRFAADDGSVADVIALCRKLEGNPLAIELAAARAGSTGLRELTALLNDRRRLLSLQGGSERARHESLQATLDWSYEWLTEPEKKLLRWWSTFAGVFSLQDAESVANGQSADRVAVSLADLVTKSLVCAHLDGGRAEYHLLDMTKAYARGKLDELGEAEQAKRGHALHQIDVMTRAEGADSDSDGDGDGDGDEDCARRVEDVREALSWAFSPGGDLLIGTRLTVAAVPLWSMLSLLVECRTHIEDLLQCREAATFVNASRRMKLLAALGVALLHTRGPVQAVEPLLIEAAAIAGALNHEPYRIRAIWSLAVYLVFVGRYRDALKQLRLHKILAETHGDRADRASGERLMATVLHYGGAQGAAEERLEHLLQAPVDEHPIAHIARFQFDQRSAARVTLANILWLRGRPDDAEKTAESAVGDARSARHPVSLCNALGHAAIPIAILNGHFETAHGHLLALRGHLTRNALPIWRDVAECLEGMLQIEQGDPLGLALMQGAHARLMEAGFLLRRSQYQLIMAKGLLMRGRMEDALGLIDETVSWCVGSGERWQLAELLRVKGDFLLVQGSASSREAAYASYRKAVAMARSQGALAWELRAAVRLAEGLVGEGRVQAAAHVLRQVLPLFTFSSQGADIRNARELADKIERSCATLSHASRPSGPGPCGD